MLIISPGFGKTGVLLVCTESEWPQEGDAGLDL